MVRNYSMQTLLLTLLFISSFIVSSNAAALTTVTASIDKNPAFLNESILLTVTADDDINRNALDTSALLTDFIVGQTSVSSQTSMVNFNTTRLTKWQVVLIARRAGSFIIPALTINNQQSAPIELTVAAQNQTGSNQQTDIFITSKLSSDSVYVQQLLTLTVKLHFAVDLKSGSLTEPNLTGATIDKIGKDKQKDVIINGKRYRVIEQSYAITPEQSGKFTLKAPVFSGEIVQASQRRSRFLSFSQGKPVSVLGDELQLSVLPIPTNYPDNAQWLPTEILTLHQEWQTTDGKFTVGEPITRTITLTAADLAKAQLPKLVMKNTPGLKIYPDQAELHSSLNNGRLVSQKVQNFALMPSVAGDFVLPSMSVTWFNTITNKIEQASLPAQTISVKAAESPYSEQQGNVQRVNLPNLVPTMSNEKHAVNTVAMPVTVTDNRLQWLFLSLWLLTALAWFLHVMYLKKSGFLPKKLRHSEHSIRNVNHYLTLLAACKKNDAEQALTLVFPWLKTLLSSTHPELEIQTIAQAQTLMQQQSFDSALNDLQQHLYGKSAIEGAAAWQGSALLSAVQKIHKQPRENNVTNQPLPLNP